MDIKKIIFISIFLMAFVFISAVGAADNATLNDSSLESAYDDVCKGSAIDSQAVNLQSSSDEGIVKSEFSGDENSDLLKSADLNITFYDDYHIYNETNIFGFLMPKDVENNVSVEIDGKPYGYEIYDINNREMWVWGGDAETQLGYMVKFSDLSVGSHKVIIHYLGDKSYDESRLVENITVHEGLDYNPDNEFFSIDYFTDDYFYGKTNILAFIMPKDVENNASVQIDWKDYDSVKCDINDSMWKWGGDPQTQQGYIVRFADLKPGNHDIFITYGGDNKYSASGRIIYIIVHSADADNKTPSKLTAANLNTYYKSGRSFVAALTDEIGNVIINADINICFSGKNKTLKTDYNGQVKLTTGKMIPKSYDVILTYLGNDYYTNSAAKAKITIKKIVPKITAPKKTFKKSLKTKKYTITLKANSKAIKNTNVYLKIKGKTYTAKTNRFGKATFKINKLTKKGTYNAKVKYAGSKYFAAKTVKTKIICK